MQDQPLTIIAPGISSSDTIMSGVITATFTDTRLPLCELEIPEKGQE